MPLLLTGGGRHTTVSDLGGAQAEREHKQVRAFLANLGIAYSRLSSGNDPPDVVVHRGNMPAIEIEVTEYHPEDDRVGIEKRWQQLRDLLYSAIKEHPQLKGVSITPVFRDPRLPQRRHHPAIAESLCACAEHLLHQGWAGPERLRVVFVDYVDPGFYRRMGPRQHVLPAREWPILARHVNVIYMQSISWNGYFPVNNPQAQTAWCSPYPAAFLDILERKESKIRSAIHTGRHSKGEGPLLLLIVSNVPGDLSSSVFGDEHLEEVIRESGFDFEGSVFDEIWLMEAYSGESQCLFPWARQGGEGLS
jgi:hypothetical protein